MTSSTQNVTDLYKAIEDSKGAAHLNREYKRSFSLNIFLMNSQELVELTLQVQDPDEGLRLMSEDHREAGNQIHREISRRIHNFAVSALTLVTHTGIFMRKHYKDSETLEKYVTKITADFSEDPVSQFVQGLRNYMVHKGLPKSEMYLNLANDPASGQGAQVETGVRLGAKSLLEWDEWKKPARDYLNNCGEFVDIRAFAEEYTNRVKTFQEWLQTQLTLHHDSDLKELRELQIKLQELRGSTTPQATNALFKPAENADETLRFATEKLRQNSMGLLSRIQKLELQKTKQQEFKSERPNAPTLITDEHIIGTPQAWCVDSEGRRVFAFIANNEGVFGLDTFSYGDIGSLTEDVLKLEWAKDHLSRGFLETKVIDWLISSFGNKEPTTLLSFLENESKKAITTWTLWLPVAHFEVEEAFSFGPVSISSVTANMLNEMEKEFSISMPNDSEGLKEKFDEVRTRTQGLAAVVIERTCEAQKLQDDGIALARAVVGLLRFMSPAATNPNLTCGVALLGTDIVPSQNLMIVAPGRFSFNQTMLGKGDPDMRFPRGTAAKYNEAFGVLGSLVSPEGLTQLGYKLRESILLFTTGLTLTDPVERLSYCVSAMEKLLLFHSAEPPEFSVTGRMRAILIRTQNFGNQDPAFIAREAYRILARRDLTPLAPYQLNSAMRFILNTYLVLDCALINVRIFNSSQDFVAAILAFNNKTAENSGANQNVG